MRYAVKVNGELTKPVVPSRGIRQGDPISRCLFLLYTEGLSSLLHQKESLWDLQGIRNDVKGQRSHTFSLLMTSFFLQK
jgi:hypothetical protein